MRFKKAISLIMSVSLVASMAAVNLSAVETRDNTSLKDNLQISSQKTANNTADETVIELSLEEFQQYKSISTYATVPDTSTTASYDEDAIFKHICNNMTNVPNASDTEAEFTPSDGGTQQKKKCRRIDLSQFNIKAADYQIAFDLLFKAFDQRPEIFNRDDDFKMSASQNTNSNGEEIVVAVSYPYLEPDTAKAQVMQNELDAKVSEITTQASKCGTDIEKLLYVYNSLINTITYTKEKPIPSVSRNVYNALVKGDSVCDGYAKSLKYILNQLNIPAERVVSVGNGGMNHAWNVVQIDNKWYYCDLTWDDPDIDGRTRGYKYFMKSEAEFRNDPTNKHYANDWTISNVPVDKTGKKPNEAYTGEKFWQSASFVMPYINGKWYTCEDLTTDIYNQKYMICTYDVGQNIYTPVAEEPISWDVVSDQGGIYPGLHMAMQSDGNNVVYYTTPTSIMRIIDDPNLTDKVFTLYTLPEAEKAKGRIYSLSRTGNTLKYGMKSDANKDDFTYGEINSAAILRTNQGVLTDKILLNYEMYLDRSVVKDTDYMLFTVVDNNNRTIKVPVSEITPDDWGYYTFTCPLAAKEMADTIKAEFYIDGKPVVTNITTMRDYAEKAMAGLGDTGKDKKTKKIMSTMLNYGTVAQQYFNHNIDNLANKNLPNEEKTINANHNFSQYTQQIEGGMPEGIKYYSNTLNLESKIGMVFYFEVSGGHNIDEYNFCMKDANGGVIDNGQYTIKPVSDSMYRLEYPVFMNALNANISLSVKNEKNTQTIVSSPFSYAASMYGKNIQNLDKLLDAMADCNDAIKSPEDSGGDNPPPGWDELLGF